MFITYICLLFIISVYLYYVFKPKNDFQIIQTNLSNISDSVLYEKYPILISDNIINIYDLLDSLFKYQYLFKTDIVLKVPFIKKNNAKFLVVHNNNETDKTVSLSSPNKTTTGVDIIIPSYNILIVPYSWTIYSSSTSGSSDTEFKCLLLNDFFHFLFNIHIN